MNIDGDLSVPGGVESRISMSGGVPSTDLEAVDVGAETFFLSFIARRVINVIVVLHCY